MTAYLPIHLSPAERLLKWLRRPDRAYQRWLGAPTVCAAWISLVVAVVSPPHGMGIKVCLFNAMTGVPCIGCGLTRSLSCGIRGMLGESLHYHPFGLFILSLFLIAAVTSLLPRSSKADIVRYMESRATFFNGLYLGFVVSFVGFGIVRAVLHIF
jgi:hypothetical protein